MFSGVRRCGDCSIATASSIREKAIADFDRAIDLNPKGLAQYGTGAILAYGSRRNAYNEKGDAKRAIEDYTMAIAIDPKYTASCTSRGLQYQGQESPHLQKLLIV